MNEIREYLDECYEGAAILEPDYLDEAIIGTSHDGCVVYSFEKLVQAFMEQDGMTYEEAVEQIEYNTIRAIPYMGDFPPVIVYDLPEL